MPEQQLLERTISGLHDALIRSLPPLNRDRPVLDIGCGTGAWLERLAHNGFTDLCGVDLDIKQFKTDRAKVLQANLDDCALNFEHKFGFISAIEIIEHLENPGRLFDFVRQNLDDNGYFLLTTPNIHSVSCRLKFLITGKLASFDEKGDPTHIYPVLLQSLSRILPRYSLQITKQWGYPDRGSLIYQSSTQLFSRLLAGVLPSDNPGDTLCLLIQKQK
jgi:2-polyprenyl-3-methyl-5-hydroxy-6-metoxy-1,4-benzoquinol methylase